MCKIISHEAALSKLLSLYRGLGGWPPALGRVLPVASHIEGDTVYGDISGEGMKLLAEKLALTKDDVFYDLYSGLGRLVIYLYLTTPVKRSVGIEAISRKYDRAWGLTEM